MWYLDLICKFPRYLPNIGYDLVVDEPQKNKVNIWWHIFVTTRSSIEVDR
jgi:hypothetical protein